MSTVMWNILQLSSISELENVTVEQEVDKNPERKMQYDKDETRLQDMKEVNTLQTEIANLQTEPKEEITMAANDSQYARFFRMIQVGVPVQAVRLKMQYEGLDPSILEE